MAPGTGVDDGQRAGSCRAEEAVRLLNQPRASMPRRRIRTLWTVKRRPGSLAAVARKNFGYRGRVRRRRYSDPRAPVQLWRRPRGSRMQCDRNHCTRRHKTGGYDSTSRPLSTSTTRHGQNLADIYEHRLCRAHVQGCGRYSAIGSQHAAPKAAKRDGYVAAKYTVQDDL